MKKYHLKFITLTLGAIAFSLLTSSLSWADGKEGVVRISDGKQQPVTTQPVHQTSFNQPTVASLVSHPLPGSPSCTNCKNHSSHHAQTENHHHSHHGIEDAECDDCHHGCKSCGLLSMPYYKLVMLKIHTSNFVNKFFCKLHGCKIEGIEGEFEVELDEYGHKIKKHRKDKGPRIRKGRYTKVYSVDPWHSDVRDGRVYAAKGYGIPMTVPLPPNVEHEYNYGWGIPSSRLTPISKPPARNLRAPYPARRYPVQAPGHRYRIETPLFQGK